MVTTITCVDPVIEIVRAAQVFHLSSQRVGSLEGGALSGMNGIGLPVAGGFTFSPAYAHDGVASIFAGFYAVLPWLRDGEGLVRRIDLKHVVAIEIADTHTDGPRTELNLGCAVVEI